MKTLDRGKSAWTFSGSTTYLLNFANLAGKFTIFSKVFVIDNLGEANCSARQSFDPSSKIEVFTFYLLGVSLAHLMFVGIEVAFVSSPVVRVITADIERRKQRFQVLENRVLALAEYKSQYGIGGMVDGVPEPTLV